jgi:hypothetical protein
LASATRRLGLRQVALVRQQLLDQAARQRAVALQPRPVTPISASATSALGITLTGHGTTMNTAAMADAA